ncbi:hypothetical protein [Amniculibacterium sp. G2-70]|uniref:hypothetical protein n=1 Tax=Amniculibacterium sp. G2-70 TaxID=2767188 RepID=UPI0016544143|nr:hypothetical protein [Amniculibacterium sp. G2-70]
MVKLLDSKSKSELLTQFNGRQDNTLRKKWTARTFLLSDSSIIVEFYDKNAVIIDNLEKFKKLEEIRFVKNTIWNLKKNISYKIELTFEKGNNIVQVENPKQLKNLKSEMPEHFDFEVYQLNTGQILFIDKSQNFKSAAIYPDLKTLSSENNTIAEQVYGSDDDEYLMKKLASGDPLLEYEPSDHLIYPKYEKDLIKNHKLTLIESKVFVASDFYGNLYKSENGYYILLDDFNQLNVAKSEKIGIGTLRVYNNIDEVRVAQKRYEEFKDKGVTSEHFYQKISDTYGQNFPKMVNQLIDKLPELLNFDKEQLSLDSLGIDLIDEALKWNGTDDKLFDSWFPSVLAFYGQAYIADKKDGNWTMLYEKEDKVWIPEITLNDGFPAWDWRDFYKDLYEGPIPLKWAGDWDGNMRKWRNKK